MNIEEQLIQKCLRNEPKAQKQFYKAFAAKMYGICLRFVKNEMEADDLLQEGFIKVFENLKNFRNEGSIEGWVRRIIVNTAINYIKKNVVFHQEVDIENIGEFEIIEDSAISKLSMEDLLKMIQDLPDGKRMVFNLYTFEGYAHHEIAEIMGISVNTSKSQLAKAKKILQEKLKNVYVKRYEKTI